MRYLLILLMMASSTLHATDYYQFLKKENDKSKVNVSKKNKYNDIISGGAAFVIGNIGYFSTSKPTSKLAYSLVQTIGILNLSSGIQELYSTSEEKDHFRLATQIKSANKKINSNKFSEQIIRIRARKEKAKRLSILYASSFLSLQYIINITLSNPDSSLKNIYTFLGSINAMVAANAYFSKGEYEDFYYSNRVSMVLYKINEKQTAPGISYNLRF